MHSLTTENKRLVKRLVEERSEYTRHGGDWLGAARNWVKWNCHNGCEVTWGSNDELRPALTIGQVEDLASRVADAANSDADKNRVLLNDLQKRRLELEVLTSGLTEKVNRITDEGKENASAVSILRNGCRDLYSIPLDEQSSSPEDMALWAISTIRRLHIEGGKK